MSALAIPDTSPYKTPVDWRGNRIEIGSLVTYEVTTKGGRTVEAEVVDIVKGVASSGLGIVVQPIRHSMIRAHHQPSSRPHDNRPVVIPQLKVTVIS